MSKIKKLIALTLALAMVLSVSAFAGNYSANTYADAAQIDGDCEAAVELLYALDIMVGDGVNFKPESAVTRAEMAKMIYVILNYGDDDKAVSYKGGKFFSDVATGAWYEGYVNYAAATKLVQGRPDGTFGPDDGVTTAEAAKMLLTAIGYSAEARGYTGANWDKNVLSDAAILGLLEGYKTNVNGMAPRQWVAVMMANALEANTFDTMYPSFDGLLISGSTNWTYPTMMGKYLGAEVVKGIMTSANGYIIDGEKVAGSGEVVVNGVEFEADATIEDLGQEFKAIVVDDEAISLRNTGKSVVAEDEVKDVTYELAYGTSANKADNKYVFTVADLSGKLDKVDEDDNAVANVLDVVAGNDEYEQLEASELKDEIAEGAYRNDVVRAIDANNDGDIEYVIYTPVEYAVITKVATSQKYGEYVKADDINGEALTINGGSNLYIEDCIITEDELEVGNYVKFTWNIDEEKYNVEVLPVVEFVEFESRRIAKNQYTFGGETYNIAANAFENMADLDTTGMLKDDFDIVVDGDLLVQAVKSDDNYKSMDEVNAKLAVIIKSGVRNIGDDNVDAVQLLTIDGEKAWYAYDLAGATDAYAEDTNILTWNKIADTNKDGYVADWDQLVIVHTNDDGEVYLEKLVDDDDLNLPTELVDLVEIGTKDLDVDNTIKYGGDRVAADNKFFAYVEDEYTVITMAELEKGDYSELKAWALINEGSYYDTVVGGYFIIGDADPTTSKGFLFTTDIAELEVGSNEYITVLPNSEEAEEIDVKLASDSEIPTNNYRVYRYSVTSGKYTLVTPTWDIEWAKVEADEDGALWYGKEDPVVTDDMEVFALKTIINERALKDGKWEVVATETIVEFVTLEELTEAVLEGVNADETYEYTYSVIYDAELEIMYVQIDVDMYSNQEYDADKEADAE